MSALKIITIMANSMLITLAPLYAAESSIPLNINVNSSFSEWLNSKPKKLQQADDKEVLRNQWKQALGVDVFYPYFEVKKLERKTTEKTTIRVLKMRGKAQFKEDSVKYIFSIKF